jgi:hypothetical protein
MTGCFIGRIGLYVLGFWNIEVVGKYDVREGFLPVADSLIS